MLRQILSGNFEWYELLSYVISAIIVILLVLPLHECAHGFVAYKLGDPTAKGLRRLTLNPFHHIDWLGAASIIFFGFGWAKPVPVNTRYFNNPKRDMALTALAGPVSNLFASLVASLLYNLSVFAFIETGVYFETWAYVVKYIFLFFAQINASLAVFNLIPIPPLDGSKILFAFLPNRIYYQVMKYERYFGFILLIILVSGSSTDFIGDISYNIFYFFIKLTGFIFGFNY